MPLAVPAVPLVNCTLGALYLVGGDGYHGKSIVAGGKIVGKNNRHRRERLWKGKSSINSLTGVHAAPLCIDRYLVNPYFGCDDP